MLDIATYITYAKIAQPKLSQKFQNDKYAKGGILSSNYIRILYILRKQVEWVYNINNNYAGIDAVANYMFALSGSQIINGNSVSPFIIIQQPSSQSVDVGDNVMFSVIVSGGVYPYSYQWYYNSAIISGEINSIYSINNVQESNEGSYFVVITDSNGSQLISNTVNLFVNESTIEIDWWYGDDDPYPDLSVGIDNLTYQGNFNIVHNANINVPFPQAASNNKFLVIKVPASENIKTNWYNTSFNNGTIPDQVFRSYITIGSNNYYVTRLQVSIDYTVPLILS